MKFGERNENKWFWDAVETKPERGALEVQGANVNFFFHGAGKARDFFSFMATTRTQGGGIL